jgi:hypothetical protein
MRRRRGFVLAEVLVGTALALALLAAMTAAVGVEGRMLVGSGARAESEDTAQLAMEAFLFDLRRAGYGPAAIGPAALLEALADGLALTADLDGDGRIATDSEESVAWRCVLPAGGCRVSSDGSRFPWRRTSSAASSATSTATDCPSRRRWRPRSCRASGPSSWRYGSCRRDCRTRARARCCRSAGRAVKHHRHRQGGALVATLATLAFSAALVAALADLVRTRSG